MAGGSIGGVSPTSPSQKWFQSPQFKETVEYFEECIFASDRPTGEDSGAKGSITSFEKAKHVVKGVGLTFTSMLKNWQVTAVSSAVLGAVLTFCPTLMVPMVVAGTFLGGAQILGGMVKANNSSKKIDQRKAYQQIGAGIVSFLPSFLGCKSALKLANRHGVVSNVSGDKAGTFESFLECCKLSLGIKPAGVNSETIYSVAGKTAASKFNQIFHLGNKDCNGNFENFVNQTKDDIKSANSNAKKDFESKNDALNDAKAEKSIKEQESINLEAEKKSLDIKIKKYREELDNRIVSESKYIEKKGVKINELKCKLDEVNKSISEIDHELQLRAAKAVDNTDVILLAEHKKSELEKMQKIIRQSIDDVNSQSWDDYESAMNFMENELNGELIDNQLDLQKRLSTFKETEVVPANKNYDSAYEDFGDASVNLDKLKKVKKTFEAFVENSESYSQILRKTGSFDDIQYINGYSKDLDSVVGEVQNAINDNKKFLVFAPKDNALKLQRSVYNKILYAPSSTTPYLPFEVQHDICGKYVSFENTNDILIALDQLHPVENLFGKNSQLSNVLLRVLEFFSLGQMFKK